MDIQLVQEKIKQSDYRFSDHAVKRMIERAISRSEIEEVVLNGEIIEEYPTDKYSPSCLIYGETRAGRSLHVRLSYPPKIVVITTYEPALDEWIDGRVRR